MSMTRKISQRFRSNSSDKGGLPHSHSSPATDKEANADQRELFDDHPSTMRNLSRMGAFMQAGHDDLLLEPLLGAQGINVGEYKDSPIDTVKQMLRLDKEDRGHLKVPQMFCEQMELEEENYLWNEKTRWIKFEESVEEGGTRWSKPHITLLNIEPLLQLRNCLRRGPALFDLPHQTYPKIIGAVVENWKKRNEIAPAEADEVRHVLMAPKYHLLSNRLRPIHVGSNSDLRNAEDDEEDVKISSPSTGKLHQEFHVIVNRLGRGGNNNNTGKSNLIGKLPQNSESAVVLTGRFSELKQPLSTFVRLQSATLLYPEMPELPVSVRYLFILLIPYDHYQDETVEIGKCMGCLFTDEIYSRVACKAQSNADLSAGIDEFLSQNTLIPAGKWNRDTRFEPLEDMKPAERRVGSKLNDDDSLDSTGEHKKLGGSRQVGAMSHQPEGLQRTGRILGGLIQDIKRKGKWYKSDYTDAFRGRLTQIVAASIFLFFSNVTKIITFGGVMGKMLEGNMGTVENLLSGGICGVIYALFAGQPICVLSATGPTLVFEFIMYEFCGTMHWDFLVTRFWLGIWCAFFLLIIVATDASVIVGLITRFTEEAFATLISVIFIIQAFEKLFGIMADNPMIFEPQKILQDPCLCNVTGLQNITRPFVSDHNYTGDFVTDITGKECTLLGGTGFGAQCDFHPDVFLFSVMLFFGTFVIAIGLKIFRHSSYLPSKIRNSISDFNVLIAIVIMTGSSLLVGLEVPALKIPDEFRPTKDRSWIVDPLNLKDGWYIPLAASLPALFFTILVFMDQHITAVIINRKDNKLRKGAGYHLDLLVISLCMIVCSLFGIPFYVAATVISIIHLDSLRVSSETAAPGEKPQFLGVQEQRITALVAHIGIGCAVFITPVIKIVPMPVLLGVFLYMGTVSLIGQQFVQRVAILFMPMKHQPDYSWLRTVRLKRVHLFTAIQLLALAGLFVVKYIKSISMVFPLMLIVMVVIRMLMDKIFTQKELHALDDPLPTLKQLFRTAKNSARIANAAENDDMNNSPQEISLLKVDKIYEEDENVVGDQDLNDEDQNTQKLL